MIAKNSNFEILQVTLYATHLLKLLHKIYKYEMDPTRTVGAIEQMDGQTDGRMDGRSENNIPPNNFVVQGCNDFQERCSHKKILYESPQE